MKKIIVLIAAVALSAGAFAQNRYNWDDIRGWDFGVKAGVNIAELSDFGTLDTKMKTSFYVGLFAEYRMNYWFGIQPEVVYSSQGNKYTILNSSLNGKFDYINVPVLAKFYILDNLSVNVGPQFGFLVNHEVNLSDYEVTDSGNLSDAGGFDFSVAMGLNYTIVSHLDITARYNLGMTDVLKNFPGTNRNGVIQLGLGYRF